MLRKSIFLLIVNVVLFGGSATVHASDGVIELNQSCAVGDGCLSGDATGFPISISAGGPTSFILTSDLVVPDAFTDAIEMTGLDGVHVDLNGFAIRGVTLCSGSPATCTSTGSGTGIDAASVSGVTVENGTVTGMGNYGLFLGPESSVHKVRARGNGTAGIRLSNDGGIFDSVASSNGGHGVDAGSGATIKNARSAHNGDDGFDLSDSTIEGSVSRNNGGVGISASNTLVVECRVFNNAQEGIVATSGVVARGNHVTGNGAGGIQTTSYGLFIGNYARANGTTTSDNGIQCTSSCSFIDNVSVFNAGDGIRGGSTVGYQGTVTGLNGGAPVGGSAVDLGGNLPN